MAKRRGRPPGRSRSAQAAETIGAALGGVMAKVDAWMAQREEIARELRQVADQMMSGESPYPWGRKKRLSPQASQALSTMAAGADSERRIGRTARKKRTMSAEARAKISAAQKARWARQHAEGTSAKKKAKKGRSGRI